MVDNHFVIIVRILIHDYTGHPFQIQLGRSLASRGHKVTLAFASELLTPRGFLKHKPSDPDCFKILEVAMSPDYRANKYNFLKRRGYEVAYGQELVSLLDTYKPEILISGNTPTEPQLSLFKKARERAIPAIFWVQDFYSIAVEKLARKKLPMIGFCAGKFYRYLDKKCFSISSHIIAITEDFTQILKDYRVAPEKISVIPNWAPLDELPVRPRHNFWSAQQGLDEQFVFMYSGTLAMKHNPDLLLQLAVKYRNLPNVSVVVISEGPGSDWLKKEKNSLGLNQLKILPFQAFEIMPEVMASSDVLIAVLEPDAGVFSVPSKVLTYHCAQRPILGAIPIENLAGRIIERNGTGVCISPTDMEGFLATAEKLRTDHDFSGRIALNARKYAEKHFDIQTITDKFEGIFDMANSNAQKQRGIH